MADTSIQKQIIEKLKNSNNVLVTVSSSPTVDQLSAALSITLVLNKLGKHATAVFSGNIPAAIEFLEPHKTFENTVDSLRDFIIALDKEKADHLRYKVVDDMVKIFITPYRTTISERDLDFSQGDYNVEMVLAIGVKTEEDLDHALQSHGRILHDATVAAISLGEATNLGGIEWTDKTASSYSEMMTSLVEGLKLEKNLLDEQVATALLTGIVAATDRFSNDKTSSRIMTVAAQLMAAGANQQLIATQLEKGDELPLANTELVVESQKEQDNQESQSIKVDRSEPVKPEQETGVDGALAISHVLVGSVEEVAKMVAEQESEEALSEAKAALENEANQAASQKQANEVSAKGGLTTSETPLASDIISPVLRGPVSEDEWRSQTLTASEPVMGGTFNATSEQAALDKQRQIADDRNKTILTHEGNSYISKEPSFQAPLNSVTSHDTEELTIPDILAEGNHTEATVHADVVQPPAPSAAAPTLAEIDAQNRAHQDTAMAAVDAAFGAPVSQAPAAQFDAAAPALPPLPPMPDFSTLPPLPSVPAGTPLGDVLPPLAPVGPIGSGAAPAGVPVDPAQFRIPGQ